MGARLKLPLREASDALSVYSAAHPLVGACPRYQQVQGWCTAAAIGSDGHPGPLTVPTITSFSPRGELRTTLLTAVKAYLPGLAPPPEACGGAGGAGGDGGGAGGGGGGGDAGGVAVDDSPLRQRRPLTVEEKRLKFGVVKETVLPDILRMFGLTADEVHRIPEEILDAFLAPSLAASHCIMQGRVWARAAGTVRSGLPQGCWATIIAAFAEAIPSWVWTAAGTCLVSTPAPLLPWA